MRKIGELKGKPIIEGNPNEIKKNQIHYKESDGNITLSERKEDNTLSSVTSGSGSGEGGGVKEYYYKVLSHTNINGESPLILFTQFGIIPFNNYIQKGNKITYNIYQENNAFEAVPTHTSFLGGSRDEIQAFSCLDVEVFLKFINVGTHIKISKGNLYDRVLELCGYLAEEEGGVTEYMEYMKSVCLNYLQEITKEEYESMITYKPE